jgi:alkylated DNA repair dioxygenase AlkB
MWILELQKSVQCAVDAMPHIPSVVFNSALVNWYKDGSEGIARHQDKQPAWGPTPTIAVVSLGAARRIVFEPLVVEPCRPRAMKRDKKINTVEFVLQSGDLLVMSGRTNDHYCHSIPIDAACPDQRWSVTFRMVNHDYS